MPRIVLPGGVVPAIDVQLLTTPGCPHAGDARALVLAVLQQLGQPFDLSEIVVADGTAAAASAFPGSPTVRVGGRDVDPSGAATVALACRRYRQPDGSAAGIPSRAAIEAAVAAWREAQRSAGEGSASA